MADSFEAAQQSLRERAADLLSSGEVQLIIGWEATRTPGKTRPAFVRTAEDAGRLVWNENCFNSTAKYLLNYRNFDGKIGICARYSDSRALNRLMSDGQVQREKIHIFGMCSDAGTPLVYDELFGTPSEPAAAPDRFAEVDRVAALPLKERQAYWENQFSKCIRCYACRNVCPCCSCKECYLDQYRTGWQGKAMNTEESRFYGLTRAYHVGDRCIECGECERVCPMDIPIMLQTGRILKTCETLYGTGPRGMAEDETHPLGEFDLNDPDFFM